MLSHRIWLASVCVKVQSRGRKAKAAPRPEDARERSTCASLQSTEKSWPPDTRRCVYSKEDGAFYQFIVTFEEEKQYISERANISFQMPPWV